jgi:hypothetical protein
MPKIRILKSESGIMWMGKYLSILDFIKLRQIMNKYLTALNGGNKT